MDDVASALQLDRTAVAQRLSRWTEQGWLRRVGRGAYVAASIDTMGSDRVLDDPWVLVPALFAPAYIGGRTAAEHWDLTAQVFKDILAMTAQAVRRKRQERHGALFSLKHIDERKLFGTKNVWPHQTRVPVSNVHRTVIDMLDDRAVGGGIQHIADCVAAYLRRDDRDDEKLIEYAVRLSNGAVFKRRGFSPSAYPTVLNSPAFASTISAAAMQSSTLPRIGRASGQSGGCACHSAGLARKRYDRKARNPRHLPTDVPHATRR